MSNEKIGVVRETENGKWVIEVDGIEILQTKSLVWVKSNARKSAKLRKSGVRVFDVTENGKVTRWDMDAKPVRKPITAKKSSKKGKKSAKASTPTVETITVVVEGMLSLEGKTKKGKLLSQSPQVTVLEFQTKDGLKFPTEFSTKTGEQLNHSPHYGWKIVKSA